MCFRRKNIPFHAPKHSQRYFHFFQQVIPGVNNGQLNMRVCLMASLVQACICNGHSRLESLSESSDACRALKKSSLLQQAKRWLSNKWTDWQTFYLPFVRKPPANNTLFFRLLFRSIARSSFLQARLNLERCFFNRGVTQSYLSLRNSASYSA